MMLNGRRVVVDGVADVDSNDYPDFCDARFEGCRFEDTGEYLDPDQCQELQELYPELLWEMAYESLY